MTYLCRNMNFVAFFYKYCFERRNLIVRRFTMMCASRLQKNNPFSLHDPVCLVDLSHVIVPVCFDVFIAYFAAFKYGNISFIFTAANHIVMNFWTFCIRLFEYFLHLTVFTY